jgi:hypothetical protein
MLEVQLKGIPQEIPGVLSNAPEFTYQQFALFTVPVSTWSRRIVQIKERARGREGEEGRGRERMRETWNGQKLLRNFEVCRHLAFNSTLLSFSKFDYTLGSLLPFLQ